MTPRAQPMRVSFLTLLGWVLAAGLLVGLAGAYPTWRLRGHGGLWAQAAAGGIVLAAVVLSACLVAGAAFCGPAKAAWAFVGTAAVRLGFSAALGAMAIWRLEVCESTFLTWLAIFYGAMVTGEVVWLAGALRRDARRAMLEEIDRSGRDLWDGV